MNLSLKINWKEYMSRHDMLWNKMPEYWDEAPFMGNGMMGTYICKSKNDKALFLSVGHCNVHDHRDFVRGGEMYAIPRLPIGHFLIHTNGNIIGCNLRLDLWNAETKGEIITDKGCIKLHSLVHSDEMCIICTVEPDEGENGCFFEWVVEKAISPRQQYAIDRNELWRAKADYIDNPPSYLQQTEDITVCVQPLLCGGQTATAWTVKDCEKSKTLFVSTTHSYPKITATNEAIDTIKKVISTSMKDLLETHRLWWNNYYQKSFMTIPDAKLESFYWIQMYKLASATRADRALIDNQGPWLAETPWPGSWWNLNVQLTYWSFYASNRCELAESLLNTLDIHRASLIQNVAEEYRHDSAGIGTASSPELKSYIKIPGKDTTGLVELGNLSWALHNCWLHYRMTMNKDILENIIFPLLKRAVNYYFHFITEDEQGVLHLMPTASPEYGVVAEDTTFELAFIRWGCSTLISACETLGISDPLTDKWKHTLEHLAEYPENPTEGFMIAKDTPYAMSHRHFSHLIMIYPLYMLNIEQKGAKESIVKTLNHWQSKKESLEGYSYTGASLICSAMGNGDDALIYLKGLFGKFLRPNTMYKEAGPVIETPLSAAQCIHDMLLQSWGGKIRVFPAVPKIWKDVAFHDFRAEGAFLVSAVKKDGNTRFIRIKSLDGQPCLIKTDIKNPTNTFGETINLMDNIIKLDLKVGEEYIILNGDFNTDMEITPCETKFGSLNEFGIRI